MTTFRWKVGSKTNNPKKSTPHFKQLPLELTQISHLFDRTFFDRTFVYYLWSIFVSGFSWFIYLFCDGDKLASLTSDGSANGCWYFRVFMDRDNSDTFKCRLIVQVISHVAVISHTGIKRKLWWPGENCFSQNS